MQRALLTLLLIVSACFVSPSLSRAAGGSEDAAIAEAGNTFFKKYLGSKDQFAYLLKSPLVTPAAKSAFQAIKKKAGKDGLDYDPALKGQDHADSYTIGKIHVQGTTATASAEAKGWPGIPMRFVHGKDGWQIDGVGEINIAGKH